MSKKVNSQQISFERLDELIKEAQAINPQKLNLKQIEEANKSLDKIEQTINTCADSFEEEIADKYNEDIDYWHRF